MDQERTIKEHYGNTGLLHHVPNKRRKRRPSQAKMRNELISQLRQSLLTSQEKMNDPELSAVERQRWTQVHAYTAQVLNTILRDQQFNEWEKRLKELEEEGLIPDRTITNSSGP